MPTDPHHELDRGDIEAALQARAELGPAYDKELVEAFAERIEAAVAARAAEQAGGLAKDSAGPGQRQFVLGLVSLGCGIPLTAIAGGVADVPGIFLTWLGIVGVNAAHAWESRRSR